MGKGTLTIVVLVFSLCITAFRCSSHEPHSNQNALSDQNNLQSMINALDAEDDGVIIDAVESIKSIAYNKGLDDPDVILEKFSNILHESDNIELKIDIVIGVACIGKMPDSNLSGYEEYFNSDDPKIRRDAEYRFCQSYLVVEDVAGILVDAHDDSSCEVVLTAAEQLTMLIAEANNVLPKYLDYLSDESIEIRSSFTKIISNIGDLPDDIYSELIICIQNDHSIVRDILHGTFKSMGPKPEVVDAMIETIKEGYIYTRGNVILNLGWYGVDAIKAVPTIVELFYDDLIISSPSGETVRSACLTALGSFGRYDDIAVQTLIDVLHNDANPRLRWFAGYELEIVGPKPGVVDALCSAYDDESTKVRHIVLQTLGHMGGDAEYVITKLKEIRKNEENKEKRASIDRVIQKLLSESNDIPKKD